MMVSIDVSYHVKFSVSFIKSLIFFPTCIIPLKKNTLGLPKVVSKTTFLTVIKVVLYEFYCKLPSSRTILNLYRRYMAFGSLTI